VDENDPEAVSFTLKIDAMVDSEVVTDGENMLEVVEIEDENDKETGLVPGGEEPPKRVDEYMSNPLAFGDSGWGRGCGGDTGGIGKLVTGAACTCRKCVVKNTGRRARNMEKVRLNPRLYEKAILPDGRILMNLFANTELYNASSSAWSCGRWFS